jgi:hypothetical protein
VLSKTARAAVTEMYEELAEDVGARLSWERESELVEVV